MQKKNSDIDVIFVKEKFERHNKKWLKEELINIHKTLNRKIDEEVAFNNKLFLTFDDLFKLLAFDYEVHFDIFLTNEILNSNLFIKRLMSVAIMTAKKIIYGKKFFNNFANWIRTKIIINFFKKFSKVHPYSNHIRDFKTNIDFNNYKDFLGIKNLDNFLKTNKISWDKNRYNMNNGIIFHNDFSGEESSISAFLLQILKNDFNTKNKTIVEFYKHSIYKELKKINEKIIVKECLNLNKMSILNKKDVLEYANENKDKLILYDESKLYLSQNWNELTLLKDELPNNLIIMYSKEKIFNNCNNSLIVMVMSNELSKRYYQENTKIKIPKYLMQQKDYLKVETVRSQIKRNIEYIKNNLKNTKEYKFIIFEEVGMIQLSFFDKNKFKLFLDRLKTFNIYFKEHNKTVSINATNIFIVEKIIQELKELMD
ncbi:hypothetical protein [Metamycoplasma arthritidis]|uniref:hypothetical protein n=1 Tax=Metamycoplasma arthritidis TaxID=2111 RepID=UPI00101C97F7|nr:hypothetical protein [Metamycoplasma arthritidis]